MTAFFFVFLAIWRAVRAWIFFVLDDELGARRTGGVGNWESGNDDFDVLELRFSRRE